MVALRFPSDEPARRTPFHVADEVRESLRARSPKRFGQLNVRIANGAVALTGSVPNWQSKTLAIRLAREAFQGVRVIDALEVRNRRTFAARV
jgi:osmotically-inducible protein OsmY